jgi:anti-anti-sigma factor
MVVNLNGDYDVSMVPKLRLELEAIESAPRAVVDLSYVTYVDSSCIAELLIFNHFRKRSGLSPLTIVSRPGNPMVWRVFEICGIAMACKLIEKGPTRDEPVKT